MNTIIGLKKKILQCDAVLRSKNIRVTLWLDHDTFKDTGFGSTNGDEFAGIIPQKVIKDRIRAKRAELKRDLRKVIKEIPEDRREQVVDSIDGLVAKEVARGFT